MKKNIVAIVAIIALVAVLGVVLCACNADSYQKKLEKAGYTVEVMSEEDAEEAFGEDSEVEWAVYAIKAGDGGLISKVVDADAGYVIKFADKADAEDAEKDAEDAGFTVYRSGKIVIAGSEGFVKDAK